MVLEIALPVAWSIGQSVIKLDPLCLTKTFCLKPYFVMNTMFFVIFFAAAFRWYLATRFKAEIRRVRGVGRVGSWSWKSNIWRRKSQNDASWQVEFPLNVKIDKSIWQQMVRRISKSISRLFYPIIADWKGLVFQNI